MRPSNLVLHLHPLSSCCHKVLIALDELGIEATHHQLNLGNPTERAAFNALSPAGKMPLLVDDGKPVFETSIIIEHLQRHHAGHAGNGKRLIPQDPDAALAVRLWDRLFDCYVMTPMQALTGDLMRPAGARDALGVSRAKDGLRATYAMVDKQLAGRTWVATDTFSMADCAAAPALFYAVTYVPVPPQHAALAAYVDRLMDRPSVARTIDAARPYFKFFPNRAGLSRRFDDQASA